MSTETTKPWLEMANAINSVRSALNSAYREQQGFESKTDDLSKATKAFGEAAKKIGETMARNESITKAQITSFNQTAQGIRNAVKEMRVMEMRYKGMQIAAMSFRDAAGAVTDKLTGFVNTAKTGIGAIMGFSVSVKALTDTTSAFKRSLFEADRVAERYGESLGSLKSAFETIRRDTEMSQQDFSNLNNAIKQLYLGIPPTAKALAGMVKELRGRVGYNDNVITATLTSLVQLQSKMPQIMDRVQGAWDKAAKGQGAAANRMAAQTRYLLQQSGASRAEIEKVMSAMEPRGSRSSPFLDFEKSMAKAEQKAKDAQVALAIKLEPTLRTVAHSLSTVADLLSGNLHSGFANVIALVGSFAIPLAAATKGVMGLVNAYKILQTAAAVKFGAGMAAGAGGVAAGAGGAAATGGAVAAGGMGTALATKGGGRAMLGIGTAAIGLSAYDAYSQSKQRGESQAVALSKGGWRAGLGVAGGIVGAGVAGLISKNPNAMKAGFAIGSSVASLGLAVADRGKKDEKGKDDLEISEKVKQIEANRIDQAQTLAAQVATMFDDYQGSAKVISDLLKGEISVGKARDYSIGKMQSIASDTERTALANSKIRENVISQSEYIKIVAGLSGSEADAKKKLAEVMKDITGYDKDRYVQATMINEELNKQIAQFDVLSSTSQQTIDGLASSIANLQSKGLFRTGFEDGLGSAVTAAEGQAGIAGEKLKASFVQALAAQGSIGNLNFDKLVDSSGLAAGAREEVDKAREEIQKLSDRRVTLSVQRDAVGEKMSYSDGTPEEKGELLKQYQDLEKQISFVTEAQEKYNATISKGMSANVSIQDVENGFAEINNRVKELQSKGDTLSPEYQALNAILADSSKLLGAVADSQEKVRQARIQQAEGPEKALLASNERAIELSKQRIQMAEAMNMGMAKSWKYNKETVALEERHLQLLTQSQARQDEIMKSAGEQAGIKIDVGFATSDLEGFLADVQKQLDEKLEAKAIKPEESVNAINAITEAANKRLDVESKIYQTTSSLLERTKQMREGWLEAITGATMGFGEMDKIIGGPDKSVTQLLKVGMPSTYKYGGLMTGPGRQTPTEYTSLYGTLKSGPGGPFGQTDLEMSGGIKEYPGNTRGLANMARAQALVGGEPRIIARGEGTGGGIAPNMDLEVLSGAAASGARNIKDFSDAIPDAIAGLKSMSIAANGGMAVGRDAFKGRTSWMGGASSGSNWGARGDGTAVHVSRNANGGLIKRFASGGYASAGQDSVFTSGIPEGSFVVKEHAARGMDWGAMGGMKVGFNTGGIVALTPGEVVLPPESAAAGARAQTMGGYAFGGTVLPGKGFQNFGNLNPSLDEYFKVDKWTKEAAKNLRRNNPLGKLTAEEAGVITKRMGAREAKLFLNPVKGAPQIATGDSFFASANDIVRAREMTAGKAKAIRVFEEAQKGKNILTTQSQKAAARTTEKVLAQKAAQRVAARKAEQVIAKKAAQKIATGTVAKVGASAALGTLATMATTAQLSYMGTSYVMEKTGWQEKVNDWFLGTRLGKHLSGAAEEKRLIESGVMTTPEEARKKAEAARNKPLSWEEIIKNERQKEIEKHKAKDNEEYATKYKEWSVGLMERIQTGETQEQQKARWGEEAQRAKTPTAKTSTKPVPIRIKRGTGVTSASELASRRQLSIEEVIAKYHGENKGFDNTKVIIPEGGQIARQATPEELARTAPVKSTTLTTGRIPLASEVNPTTGPGFKLASDMQWTGGHKYGVVKPTNKITEVGNTGASMQMPTMAIMSHDTGTSPNSRAARDHAYALSNHKQPQAQALAIGGTVRKFAVGGSIGTTAPQRNQSSKSAEPQKVVISMDRKWEGIVGNVNSDAAYGPMIW